MAKRIMELAAPLRFTDIEQDFARNLQQDLGLEPVGMDETVAEPSGGGAGGGGMHTRQTDAAAVGSIGKTAMIFGIVFFLTNKDPFADDSYPDNKSFFVFYPAGYPKKTEGTRACALIVSEAGIHNSNRSWNRMVLSVQFSMETESFRKAISERGIWKCRRNMPISE